MDDDGPKFSKLWVEGKSLPNINISRNEILRWSGWWWTEVFKVRHACSYDFYNAWQSSSSFRFRFYTSSLFQFFDLLCNFCFSLILIWAFNALTSAESFLLPLFFTGAGKLGLDACMQLWIFVSKIFSAMTMAMSIYRTLCVLVFCLIMGIFKFQIDFHPSKFHS